jgi:hypothetical protein
MGCDLNVKWLQECVYLAIFSTKYRVPSFYVDGFVVRIYTTKIYQSNWQVPLKKYFWSEIGAPPLTNQNKLYIPLSLK